MLQLENMINHKIIRFACPHPASIIHLHKVNARLSIEQHHWIWLCITLAGQSNLIFTYPAGFLRWHQCLQNQNDNREILGRKPLIPFPPLGIDVSDGTTRRMGPCAKLGNNASMNLLAWPVVKNTHYKLATHTACPGSSTEIEINAIRLYSSASWRCS